MINGTTVTVASLPNRRPLMLTAAPDADSLQVLLVITGAVHVVDADDAASVLGTGAAVVCGARTTPAITAVGDSAIAVVTVPIRHRHERRLASAAMLILSPDASLMTLAMTLLTGMLTRIAEPGEMSAPALGGLLVDVLRLAIGDAQRHHRAPLAPEVFGTAVAVLTVRSVDPDLTAESLARDLRLSPRQLDRVFRKHGTSVDHELRRARAAHALAVSAG